MAKGKLSWITGWNWRQVQLYDTTQFHKKGQQKSRSNCSDKAHTWQKHWSWWGDSGSWWVNDGSWWSDDGSLGLFMLFWCWARQKMTKPAPERAANRASSHEGSFPIFHTQLKPHSSTCGWKNFLHLIRFSKWLCTSLSLFLRSASISCKPTCQKE